MIGRTRRRHFIVLVLIGCALFLQPVSRAPGAAAGQGDDRPPGDLAQGIRKTHLPVIARQASSPPGPPPPSEGNLLQNPTGDGPHGGMPYLWLQDHGYWQTSDKLSNPSPDHKAIRGKLDSGELNGGLFPPGSQDKIYQMVALPSGYQTIHFEYGQVQHELGEFTATIYGRLIGGDWVQLWQVGLEAAYSLDEDAWEHFSHDIQAPGYDEAMLEFWLRPDSTHSGVKVTNLHLSVTD